MKLFQKHSFLFVLAFVLALILLAVCTDTFVSQAKVNSLDAPLLYDELDYKTFKNSFNGEDAELTFEGKTYYRIISYSGIPFSGKQEAVGYVRECKVVFSQIEVLYRENEKHLCQADEKNTVKAIWTSEKDEIYNMYEIFYE